MTLVCVVEPPAIEAAGMESGMAGGVATPDEIDSAWAAIKAEAAVALDRTEAVVTRSPRRARRSSKSSRRARPVRRSAASRRPGPSTSSSWAHGAAARSVAP